MPQQRIGYEKRIDFETDAIKTHGRALFDRIVLQLRLLLADGMKVVSEQVAPSSTARGSTNAEVALGNLLDT